MTSEYVEVRRAEIEGWRKLEPSLDKLADLVGAEPGENPVPRAIAEITRLRAYINQARKTLGGAVL